MFENLQEKLQRTFKTLRGQAVLNEDNIQESLREIRMALLEADVNFKVVKQLIDKIQDKALGQETGHQDCARRASLHPRPGHG
jgi:signal recognition particle subunit SRP54